MAWILTLAMLCGDINIVRAESVSGNDLVESNSAVDGNSLVVNNESMDISEEEPEEISITEQEVVFDGNDELIAQGSSCGIDWTIDAEGKLTVTGTYTEGDFLNDNTYPAWYSYRYEIKSVVVEAKNVQSTKNWFYNLIFATSYDFSLFDTSKVTDMSGMFNGCYDLQQLDVSKFNTGNVTNMSEMFSGCSVENLNLSSFDTSSVTDMSSMFKNSNILTLDVHSFNTSNVTDMSSMFYGCSEINEIDVSGFDTSNVTNMSRMFERCDALTELDLSNFNTSSVTDMSQMFCACESLASLNVESFDTSKVTTMFGMFDGCQNLAGLDLSNFNTGNVTSMRYMFSGCGLESIDGMGNLDLSSFDTSKVTDMEDMFSACKIDTLNLANFNTGNVTDMGDMFKNCTVRNLDLSSFDTRKVTDMREMFSGCGNLTSLDLSNFNMGSVQYYYDMFTDCPNLKAIKVFPLLEQDIELPISPMVDGAGNEYTGFPKGLTESIWLEVSEELIAKGSSCGIDWKINAEGKLTVTGTYTEGDFNTLVVDKYASCPAWYEYRDSITSVSVSAKNVQSTNHWFYGLTQMESVDLSSFDTSNVTDMKAMFWDCENLTNLDLSNFDTSNVTDMSYMFLNCGNLTSLNVSKFNTGNVTDMKYMFMDCYLLTSIDVSKFSTSKVTDISGMFMNCSKLDNLYMRNFDTSNVTDMRDLFNGCCNLTSLDLSNFDTSNVTHMSMMFYMCSKLKSLNLSNFNTSNVIDMSHMFVGCGTLKSLDLSKFDTSNVTDMEEMFYGCGVVSLDLSNFNTSKVTNMSRMFGACTSLTSLDVSPFDTSNVRGMFGMFGDCSNLTSLDLSKLDTSNVTDMGYMFSGCSSLKDIDVSIFNTDKTQNMMEMFSGCSSLKSIDLSNFNTSKVQSMEAMFYGCSNLTSVNLSSFNTSKVYSMAMMFCDCKSLTSLDVSNFDTSGIYDEYEGMQWMFDRCSGIKSIKAFPMLQLDVELPVSPMYDAQGNKYTAFPKDLKAGIWLATDPKKVPADPVRPTDIALNMTQADLHAGQKKTFSYTFTPADAVPKRMHAASSNEAVAKATLNEEGGYVEITALAVGTADITVTADGYTATCTVTVTDTILLDYQDGKNTTQSVHVLYGEKLSALSQLSPEREGFTFAGWYTHPGGKGNKVTANTVLTNQFVLYAYWKVNETVEEEITARLTSDQDLIYTGQALKPAVKVYAGDTLLQEKKDYAVSYKNNKNAYTYDGDDKEFDATNAPTIIITGKGIYSEKVNLYFTIQPKDIEDSDVEVQELWLKYNGKEQKKAPILTYNKKKLSEKTDITCTYPDESSGEGKTAYVSADDHTVHLIGQGNFTGERDIKLHIYDPKDLINLAKAAVPKVADKTYNGGAIELSEEELSKITLKVNGEVTTLEKDVQYTIEYKNNTAVGTATALISPVNGVSYGSKKITFKITGVAIKTAVVTGIENKIYNGSAQVQGALKVMMNGKDGGEAEELIEGTDYKAVYAKNISAGTATLTIQGKGLYTGSIKKTFKILPYDLSLADGGASAVSAGGTGSASGAGSDTTDDTESAEFIIAGESIGSVGDWTSGDNTPVVSVPYLKGGSMPAVQIKIGGRVLTEGTDYTVKYSNNKAVTTEAIAANSKKMPTITIKGKGGYMGTITKTFTIEPKSIQDVVIYAPAKAASAKAGAYLSKPVLLDDDGKALKEGTDYVIKGYTATYADGSTKELDKKSFVDQVGTVITVTVEGKGA